MCGVEKFQPAEFHERDIAAGEFDFKRTAVAGSTEQNGLLFQERTGFAMLQDALDDETCLVSLVADGDELRLRCRGTLGPEVLGEAFPGKPDDAICRGQNCLRRAIVAVERNDMRGWRELIGKVEDVA